MPLNNMGDMNRKISQNRIAILAVSQYVKNRNNIESWPKYRNTIESSHFCQFPPLVFFSCECLYCVGICIVGVCVFVLCVCRPLSGCIPYDQILYVLICVCVCCSHYLHANGVCLCVCVCVGGM